MPWSMQGAFHRLPTSEYGGWLDDVDMVMDIMGQTVCRGSNDVVTTLKVLP